MIYDFISLDKNSPVPLYRQLYESIRKAIEDSGLTEGDRLVSIRGLSEGLGISKTTVEAAYGQLCAEGYIKNSPQRGYFVQGQIIRKGEIKRESSADAAAAPKRARYDLSSKSVTVDSNGVRLWKKYVKSYLNKDYIISSYGDPQGEYALRRALSFYAYSVRGVAATEDNIVIGAGTQSLLYLICGLLRRFGSSIAVEQNASRHFIRVFRDCGFKVIEIESDRCGISIERIKSANPDFILINPSGSLKSGDRMEPERRFELTEWAKSGEKFIIEDDYNGELVYNSRAVPAMQCGCTDRVIYLGSFSKLLLPSVRIGYAVIPDMLKTIYAEDKQHLNQTASKIEQLALADYIRDGQLERHLRRLKRSYADKSALIGSLLCGALDERGIDFELKLFETSLAYELTLKARLDAAALSGLIDSASVAVIGIEERGGGTVIKFGFSGIAVSDIEAAMGEMVSAIERCLER